MSGKENTMSNAYCKFKPVSDPSMKHKSKGTRPNKPIAKKYMASNSDMSQSPRLEYQIDIMDMMPLIKFPRAIQLGGHYSARWQTGFSSSMAF